MNKLHARLKMQSREKSGNKRTEITRVQSPDIPPNLTAIGKRNE